MLINLAPYKKHSESPTPPEPPTPVEFTATINVTFPKLSTCKLYKGTTLLETETSGGSAKTVSFTVTGLSTEIVQYKVTSEMSVQSLYKYTEVTIGVFEGKTVYNATLSYDGTPSGYTGFYITCPNYHYIGITGDDYSAGPLSPVNGVVEVEVPSGTYAVACSNGGRWVGSVSDGQVVQLAF